MSLLRDSCSPSMLVHVKIHLQIGDTQLIDYFTSKNIIQNGLYFWIPITRKVMNRYIQSSDHILNQPEQEMIYVNTNDRKDLYYQYKEEKQNEDDDDEEIKKWNSLGGVDNEGEFEVRHPGTNYDSDCDDDDKKAAHKDYSPINTKAGQRLSTIAFVAPNNSYEELHASYDMQLTIRIDDYRKCLNYDFYEYKPKCRNFKVELPTNRQLKVFDDIFNPPEPQYYYDSDDNDNNNDPFLDQPVKKAKEYHPDFNDEQRKAFHMQAIMGEFFNSRVFRFRISLDSIIGARLQSAKQVFNENNEGDESEDDDDDNEDNIASVLILELNTSPLSSSSSTTVQYPFAARKVHSNFTKEMNFVPVSDWTPNQIASKASRHYIYGSLSELKELVAHLVTISPNFANLFIKPTYNNNDDDNYNNNDDKTSITNNNKNDNTLLPPASIQYDTAPAFEEENQKGQQQQDLNNNNKNKKTDSTNKKKFKMSKDDVNDLFEKKGFRTRNLCLKRAVLCGHIEINDDTNKDTVLFTGNCINCDEKVVCTFGDALKQPCYAGLDYVDGGKGGAVKCNNKECDGMYITSLCEGNPQLDDGKFHNHCTRCEDFGICIHDYRTTHCQYCDEHYFCGMQGGFACPSCGGGGSVYSGPRCVSLTDLPPPPITTWDGKIDGVVETMDSAMSESNMNPIDRVMMKVMVLGRSNYSSEAIGESTSTYLEMLSSQAATNNNGESNSFLATMLSQGLNNFEDNDEDYEMDDDDDDDDDDSHCDDDGDDDDNEIDYEE